MEKKLYRDERNKKLGGVCAGLAEYFGIDVSIIRVIFVATTIFHGTGAVIYVILWAVLPVRNPFYKNPDVDYRVPPQDSPNPFKDYTPPNFTMPNYDSSNEPFIPAKKNTNAGVIAGMILIVLGAVFLLNNFNLLPPVDFHVIWPLILVTIGIVFIFSGTKKQPWEKKDWHKTEEPAAAAEEKKEETNNDNPTTI